MPVASFHREMERRGVFYELLTQYTWALVGFVMQSTACNAIHSVERRLARWLLLAQDRMSSDEFPLTQDFVAMMLGVARPTVSVIAGTLQRAGLITYRRGHVTIVDREKLEAASCECYRTTTNLLETVGARVNGGTERQQKGPMEAKNKTGATGAIWRRGKTGKPGPKGPKMRGLRGPLHKEDVLNAVVTNFDDVYRELTRLIAIATLQQLLAAMTARPADLPASPAPDPVPVGFAS